MARDDSDHNRETGPSWDGRERRKAQRTGGRAAAWAGRRGRSGYGLESIRPHLLAQIEMQKLWNPTFPPEAPDDGTKGGGE
ncbi:hypothetical protein [Ramlibacter humi]|uniref:Uncharacterized protein n=1 Tax=Ramlibacter humi TaxID=2530451 RepID=A0A4Z0CB45_9BURK|nr:hypothetical protein [Ramlibacter humi]TFZ08887.1 hypothetical protein EZ216_07025 [Ramlibacter humi]